MRILLLSDTHGYMDNQILGMVKECDEVWHAGDFGTIEVANKIASHKPIRGVYGNIDGREIRNSFSEQLFFECQGLRIGMIHIGGYPPKYAAGVKKILKDEKPGLFVSGHSHILKVMPDNELNLLHMNPGAAGKQGFHRMRTMLRFTIKNGKIEDLQAIELGKRV